VLFLFFRRRFAAFRLDNSLLRLLRLLRQLLRFALGFRLNTLLISNSQHFLCFTTTKKKVSSYHCSNRPIVHCRRGCDFTLPPLALFLIYLFFPILLHRISLTITSGSSIRLLRLLRCLRLFIFCSSFHTSLFLLHIQHRFHGLLRRLTLRADQPNCIRCWVIGRCSGVKLDTLLLIRLP